MLIVIHGIFSQENACANIMFLSRKTGIRFTHETLFLELETVSLLAETSR